MSLFYGLTEERLQSAYYAVYGTKKVHDLWEPWHNSQQLIQLLGGLNISVEWEFNKPDIYYSRVTATSGVFKVVIEGSGRPFNEIYLEAVLGIAADIGEALEEINGS